MAAHISSPVIARAAGAQQIIKAVINATAASFIAPTISPWVTENPRLSR
jgi:hypothetical protein